MVWLKDQRKDDPSSILLSPFLQTKQRKTMKRYLRNAMLLTMLVMISLAGLAMISEEAPQASATVMQPDSPQYPTRYQTVEVDGHEIFYREAGPKDARVAGATVDGIRRRSPTARCPIHPRPECARVDVQDLRRPPCASDAPVGLLEDLKDRIAFCVSERRRA